MRINSQLNVDTYFIDIYSKLSIKRILRITILSIVFIFSFQTFFYIKDIFILYFFSKVIIPCLGFFIFLLYLFKSYLKNKIKQIDLWILFVFIFLITVSVVNSYIYYQQSLLLGLTSQIKLFAIFIFFLLRYIFSLLKVDIKDLTDAILFLGIISALIFIIINLILNPANYWHAKSFLVKYSNVKGYYFKFPMKIFAQTCLYYYFLKICHRDIRFKNILFFIILSIALFVYVKERMFIFFLAIGMLIIFLTNLKSNLAKKFFSIVSFFFIIFVIMCALCPGTYISIHNVSMLIRIHTASTILKILEKEPIRLLFGSGNLSPLNNITYQNLYGKTFWISDVGIIGLIFEFGIIGTIFLYSFIAVLYFKIRNITKNSPLILQALKVNIIILLISIPINVGIAYSIGMFMSYLVIFDFYENYKKLKPKKISLR